MLTRGHATGSGYLYAVFAGYWPGPNGTLQLRIKLGSTRDPDPVGACRARYGTLAGRVEVWWLVTSADAYRDERHSLHSAFERQRCFHDRELFTFGGREDFEAAISVFTHMHEVETASEDGAKPPRITNLREPIGLARDARDAVVRERREERAALRELHAQEVAERAACAARDAAVKHEQAINQLLAEECRVGEGLRVVAEDFNARARNMGAKRGVGTTLQRRGFLRKKQRVGERAEVWCYFGLGWQ